VDVVTDWLPERAVPTFVKKIGLLEQAKIAACIPMIQTAPDMTGGDDSA